MLTLYNVVSADGFVARPDGNEDFIPDALWQKFLELCGKYRTILFGRKTYDAMQAYEKESIDEFEKLPIRKIVISRDQDFVPKNGYAIAHSVQDAFASDPDALVSSGPVINDLVLKNNLVGKIIQYKLPEKIGRGIKVFDQKNLNSAISIETMDWKG
ncbi:MAG: hypothetical protein KGH93_01750 [Patescibacteria group bacterium]|nr:hypothetical protein [Patescibacteria group bacterium]MDE1945901.1 hypothetical protein [Patescibacteria group bacterium]